MQFQRKHRLKVDGIIGPQTGGKLAELSRQRDRSAIDRNFRVEGERRAPAMEARRATPAGTIPARDLQTRDGQRRTGERAKFDHYAQLIRANGGTVNRDGKASVLALRSRDGVTQQFEDKMVVLSPNGRVHEFEASTRPGNTTRRGVAQVLPGNYQMRANGDHYGRPSWQMFTQNGSGNVPAWRDYNRDGSYSAAERANPSTASEILIHIPNPAYQDRIPTSIGCINIRDRDLDAFTAAVGGSGRSFNLTLIDR